MNNLSRIIEELDNEPETNAVTNAVTNTEVKEEPKVEETEAKEETPKEEPARELKQPEIKDLKEVPKFEQEPLKESSEFKDESEYLEYLINRGVDEKLAKQHIADVEAENQNIQVANVTARLDASVDNYFADNRDEFNNTVTEAFNKGLGNFITSNPVLQRYVTESPCSSLILYKLAKDPNSVKDLVGSTEYEVFYNIKRMEGDLLKEREPKKEVKPLGKVGTVVTKQKDIFDDEDSLKSFIRKRK